MAAGCIRELRGHGELLCELIGGCVEATECLARCGHRDSPRELVGSSLDTGTVTLSDLPRV
jgi:hypothetical protein